MPVKVSLPDPEKCRRCRIKGKVTDTRRRSGYTARRHRCPTCGVRWTTYQSTLHPKRIRLVKPPDK